MPEVHLSNADARRFHLRAQGLLGPKRPAHNGAVHEVIDRVRLVQVDSIAVAGTNQEIALNSRIEGFVPEHLSNALYRDYAGVEHYQKCLCIMPHSAWPYYWVPRDGFRSHSRIAEFMEEHRDTAEHVMERIGAEGPLMPRDFDDDRTRMGYWGMTERIVKRVMEILWESGDLVISGRQGRMRVYDLASRHLPTNAPRPTEAEYRRRALLDVYAALRLWRTVGGTAEAWQGVRGFRREMHKELLAEGTVIPVRIEGSEREWYMLREDVALLDAPAPEYGPLRLLAPLDSAVWDRNATRDLYGFNAIFEVYKPEKEREFGYYCLPILDGIDLVGRVDITNERAKGIMRVAGLWWEPGIDPMAGELLPRLAEALTDHCRFMGLKKVRLTRKRSADIAALRGMV